MNLSHYLLDLLRSTLAKLQYPQVFLSLEVPPEPAMGDRSCAVAMTLAKALKRSPRQIAQEIKQALPTGDVYLERAEIAGSGYINFFWSQRALLDLLLGILQQGSEFGSSTIGAGERRQFEFVSANPTGPLNIVSARAAAIGDSLVRLQKKIGFQVDSEYYVNDAGRQVDLLGASVKARILEAAGTPAQIPQDGYHGSYVVELAQLALQNYAGDPRIAPDRELGQWAARLLVQQQRGALERYGVAFNRWFYESELHATNQPMQALQKLQASGYIFEQEGALFFRSTIFGDEEDRVVITSDGRPTYFLPDMAYHLDKAQRGYRKVFDLWGPDHHGHVQRMQAALRALNLPEGFLEVIIVQQVNLLRGGQPVKMSKRTGEMVAMEELLEEVGADAAKQIFLSRRWSSHLDFDIEVAKDRSEKSPVYYLQYAHARIASIFRKAPGREPLQPEDLATLSEPEEWDLLRTLSLFPDTVEAAALQLAPHRLNAYLNELAAVFHRFYHSCRVLSEDVALTRARLALCQAAQIVLREGLRLLGLNAPETM